MKRLIITEEEKRNIVNLYHNNNIILEQSDNEPVNIKLVFEPGKYKIEDAQGIDILNSQISNLRTKLAQRKDKNYITKIVCNIYFNFCWHIVLNKSYFISLELI